MERKRNKCMELGTVTLETERLVLRRFCITDVNDVYKNWGSQQEIYRFLPWEAHQSIEETQNIVGKWIERYIEKFRFFWCIELKERKESIGAIWLSNYSKENQSIDTGFCIGTEFMGRGYCTEALKRILRYIKDNKGKELKSVKGTNDLDNAASGKVFQKSGFEFKGVVHQYSESMKKCVDMNVWEYIISY